MNQINNYTKNYRSFLKWCSFDKIKGNYYLKNLSNIELYDVSLKTKSSEKFHFFNKSQLFHEIIYYHNPKSIEIGPIPFQTNLNLNICYNEINLYDYIENHQSLIKYPIKNIYILVPNIETLTQVIQEKNHIDFYPNLSYFPYLTFFSPNHHKQKEDMNKILFFLKKFYKTNENINLNTKINIKLNSDHDYIIYQMLKYYQSNINTICLTDSKTILNEEDFEYIIGTTQYYGLPYSHMALELYVNQENEKVIENIFHKALDLGIRKFNVKVNKNINETKEKNSYSNQVLNYEQVYKFMIHYITKKIDK